MEQKTLQEEQSPAFDFDEWCELAQNSPDRFEEKRRAIIDEFISSATPEIQKRLRQLQWRIDMERKRCKTPLSACMKLYDMMWDFVHAEHGFLYAVNMLQQITDGNVPKLEESRGTDTVVLLFQSYRGS